MKHCFANAHVNERRWLETGNPAVAAPRSEHRIAVSSRSKPNIADRRGLKQAKKQRIGRDGVEVVIEQLVQRQALRPGGGLTAERFRQLGPQ